MFVGNLIFADDACDMNTLGASLVNGMEDKLVMFYAWLRNKINGARTSRVFMAKSSLSSVEIEAAVF